MINGDDVLAAGATCRQLLEPFLAVDWNVPVPGLDFTVASVVAHAANGPPWYAVDLWGGPGDDAAFELTVRADRTNSALLVSLGSASRVCAASVDAAPPEDSGFGLPQIPTLRGGSLPAARCGCGARVGVVGVGDRSPVPVADPGDHPGRVGRRPTRVGVSPAAPYRLATSDGCYRALQGGARRHRVRRG
jgi:hypothetical protein